MKCIIPSQNVKIVARAIHSLAKIGDELYIEPTNNELLFFSVSSAQSALCEFKMCRSFFSSYNFTVDDGDMKCKVAMKSCLGVFKNSHCADKQVESCEIRFKSEGTVVIFYIKYSNSSTKKFFLPVIDSEKVKVDYNEEAPNRIVASAKLLASSFKNFRSNEDEITIKVSGDKVIMKNHLEPGRDKNLMRTELSFQPSEFECCSVNSPTAVTFTLKEMRAAINFAEPANLSLHIRITKPGEPIVMKSSFFPAYEATFIIATLRASKMDLETSNHLTQVSSVPSRQSSNRQDPTSVFGNARVELSRNEPVPCKATSRLLVDVEQPQLHISSNNPQEINDMPCEMANAVAPIFNSSKHNLEKQNTLSHTTFRRFNSNPSFDEQPMDVDQCTNMNIEFVTIIFRRCFTNNFIFDSLPGHEGILCESSESE